MLLRTIQEIKAVLPVGAGNEFNRLRPHLQNAENAFVIPLLGKSMYEELEEFLESLPLTTDPTPVQTATQELLRRVQFSTVHLGFFLGFDFLNVSVSDMGFNRMESDRTKSLFKYQEDNLKEYFKTAGFNALDDILNYLEENIEYFNEFKLSPGWTVFRQMFIPTARIFHEICFINNSRLTFLRMRPHMSLVESTQVLPILGQVIFDEIKSEMVKDEPAAKVESILPLIRQAIAWHSSALLMEESGADLTERGLYFTATMHNFYENHKIVPSDPNRIALLVTRNRQIGLNFLSAIKAHLSSHPEDWPSAVIPTESWRNRDNTGKKTFWA